MPGGNSQWFDVSERFRQEESGDWTCEASATTDNQLFTEQKTDPDPSVARDAAVNALLGSLGFVTP